MFQVRLLDDVGYAKRIGLNKGEVYSVDHDEDNYNLYLFRKGERHFYLKKERFEVLEAEQLILLRAKLDIFRDKLAKVSEEDRGYWLDLFNQVKDLESERNYYRGMVDGSCFNADQLIQFFRNPKGKAS